MENEKQKLQLHNWCVVEREYNGQTMKVATGVVTGHERLCDASIATTSQIKNILIDEENDEAVITTRNSIYHCPLEYCNFDRQDEDPNLLPDYPAIREKYRGKLSRPTIEPGNVLLVLANFCEYYFHSLYYVPADGSSGGEPLAYMAVPHIGIYQDSFLIMNVRKDTDVPVENGVDLRYFPHYQNIEFYEEETNDAPLFLENIGDGTLYARASCGVIKLEPGQRKRVSKENAEKEPPLLAGGDLYPAMVLGDVDFDKWIK